MNTYIVHCTRVRRWWVITIPDLPGAVSHARQLDQVDQHVAELIEATTGEKPGSYHTDIHWIDVNTAQ